MLIAIIMGLTIIGDEQPLAKHDVDVYYEGTYLLLKYLIVIEHRSRQNCLE